MVSTFSPFEHQPLGSVGCFASNALVALLLTAIPEKAFIRFDGEVPASHVCCSLNLIIAAYRISRHHDVEKRQGKRLSVRVLE